MIVFPMRTKDHVFIHGFNLINCILRYFFKHSCKIKYGFKFNYSSKLIAVKLLHVLFNVEISSKSTISMYINMILLPTRTVLL